MKTKGFSMREIFKEASIGYVLREEIELGGKQYNILEFIKMPISDALQKIKQLQSVNQDEYDNNAYGTSTFDIYHSNRKILNHLKYYIITRKEYQEKIANKTFPQKDFLETLKDTSVETTNQILKYFVWNEIMNDYNKALYIDIYKEEDGDDWW